MSAPLWTVVDVDVSQMDDMRALFQHVFGHPLSEALWRWKYDVGRGVAVGARAPSGELLAHYGGTFRQIFFFGHAALAVQIGDVMVASEGRALLSHKGPFGMVMQTFLKEHIGIAGGPLLGFGFPNARAMRLGALLGQYLQVDTIYELAWTVQKPAKTLRTYLSGAYAEAVDWEDASTPVIVDRLWASMQHDLSDLVLPLRDGAWWRHRYTNHPEHRYMCFWVRSHLTRRTVGAMVLRCHVSSDVGKARVWELMDWLCPLSETRLVLQAALSVVFAHGGTSLMGWFSSTAHAQFSGSGAVSREICAVSVTAPGNGKNFPVNDGFSVSAAAIGSKWWLTGGDTDFR